MVLDSEHTQQTTVKVSWSWVVNIKSLGHSRKISVYLNKILCLAKCRNAFLLSIVSCSFLFILGVALFLYLTRSL